MSDQEVQVTEPTSLSDTKECSMTAAEALAVAWTGVEELQRMGKVRLYHSPRTGRVWIELKETEYSETNGLIPIKKEVPTQL